MPSLPTKQRIIEEKSAHIEVKTKITLKRKSLWDQESKRSTATDKKISAFQTDTSSFAWMLLHREFKGPQ